LGLVALLAVTNASADDTVTVVLKSGGRYRGEIVEVVPNDHLTIKLISGDIRNFAWDDVDVRATASMAKAEKKANKHARKDSDEDEGPTPKKGKPGTGAIVAGAILLPIGVAFMVPGIYIAAGGLCSSSNCTTGGLGTALGATLVIAGGTLTLIGTISLFGGLAAREAASSDGFVMYRRNAFRMELTPSAPASAVGSSLQLTF
jgi:hypothetical protein